MFCRNATSNLCAQQLFEQLLSQHPGVEEQDFQEGKLEHHRTCMGHTLPEICLFKHYAGEKGTCWHTIFPQLRQLVRRLCFVANKVIKNHRIQVPWQSQ